MNILKGHKNRFLKALLWIIGVWAAVLIVLQICLSPSVLGRIVHRYADEYIDGDLSFSKVKLSLFRHFPNVGITIEDCSVTYPSDRFDSLETKGAQGMLTDHGCGETADTLASFRRFSAGINVSALLAGKIRIPHVVLIKPRIFAHSYDDGHANWNIFRLQADEDTAKTELPPVSIGRIRLLHNPHIVYTDSRDTVFMLADIGRMTFDGRIDTRKTNRNRLGLTVDSLRFAGRVASDTLGAKLDKLHIHEHHKHFDVHAEAHAFIANSVLGRMRIPVSLNGTVSFPKDSVPTMEFRNINAEIASIPLAADAKLSKINGIPYIEAEFGMDGCRVENILDDYVKRIIPSIKDFGTDAVLFVDGRCTGNIGNGNIPQFDMSLSIPEAKITHKMLTDDIDFALMTNSSCKDGKINISVSNVSVSTPGLSLKTSANLDDLLGDDPIIGLDGRIYADADSLISIVSRSSGITASGNLSANLQGSMRLSQMNMYSFSQAELDGSILSDSLYLDSPKDTISINIKGLDLKLGPETKQSRIDSTRSFRLIGLNGAIAKADINIKDDISMSGSEVSISAKNSAQALSDTSRIHPLGGHLKAGHLMLTDASGTSVAVDNTSNSFQMVPKKNQPKVPVLNLSSTNQRIFLRNGHGRIILTDSSIKGKASLNTVERRQKRKAFMDSLATVHPDIPKDSLFAHLRSQRTSYRIPEWLREEDFKEKDINIRLDESLSKYFREWDIDGNIKVRTGILMTPYLPLRNILKGMDVEFSNNEIKIDSLKVASGKSEIEAKGSLSGIRRAILGRGTYRLDMDLYSGKMDADEFLAAINTGSSFDLEDSQGQITDATDAEFLKMVVADSLDTDDIKALVVIPSNLEAELRLKGKNITFSDMEINRFEADVKMRERCMQIADSYAETNMGGCTLEAFYATRTKQNLKTGFNITLSDVTTEKVIGMMPAIDTIMPLLKSFKGLMDCEIAATASLDTCMNILTPSINGIIRIGGENLTLSDNKVFSDLAKKLKFKNSKTGKIDKMTVEGIIKDNTLEVFPFILDVDRYTLAMSGLQNFDMSFRYHVSLIRSPMVFKVGVDLYGDDFNNMKFKIGKPKYKNTKVPVFTTVIDQTRINLAQSIHDIFAKGVETAVKENEMLTAINEHKQKIGFVNAADQQLEELSAEEQMQLDDNSSENVLKETADTLNEQSGIH